MPPTPLLTSRTSVPPKLITAAPAAGPNFDLRQEDAQSDRYVTLSITRDYTTYTATIQLAGPEATSPPSSNPSTIVLLDPSAVSTPPPQPARPAQTSATIIAAGSTDPSSSAVGGAIAGAIVGSFVFVLLLWCCFYQPSIFRLEGSTVSGSSRSSRSSSSSGSMVKRTRRVRVQETRRVRISELDDD